jgi:hypothetical protein
MSIPQAWECTISSGFAIKSFFTYDNNSFIRPAVLLSIYSILNGNTTKGITNKPFIKQREQDSLTGMKH